MREKILMISNIICGLVTIVAIIFTIIDIVGGATILDALNAHATIWGAVVIMSLIIFFTKKKEDK